MLRCRFLSFFSASCLFSANVCSNTALPHSLSCPSETPIVISSFQTILYVSYLTCIFLLFIFLCFIPDIFLWHIFWSTVYLLSWVWPVLTHIHWRRESLSWTPFSASANLKSQSTEGNWGLLHVEPGREERTLILDIWGRFSRLSARGGWCSHAVGSLRPDDGNLGYRRLSWRKQSHSTNVGIWQTRLKVPT